MTSEMFADGDEIALSSETLAWQRSALALTGEIDDSTVDSARRGRFASSHRNANSNAGLG